MDTKTQFRTPGNYPTSLKPREVPPLIRNLRAFIGNDRLKAAVDRYRAPVGIAGRVRALRVQQYQPLIEAFLLFDKLTFNGRRALNKMHPGLLELASVAAMGSAVIPTLTPETANHQREALLSLDGRCKPLLLEWTCATQAIRRHNAKIAWSPPGTKGAEFIASADHTEFEVECKLQTTMITQLLGESEADRIFIAAIEEARQLGLSGEIRVEIAEPQDGSLNDEIQDIRQILRENLKPGNIQFRLSCNARVHSFLEAGPIYISEEEWAHLPHRAPATGNAYGIVDALPADKNLMADPLYVYIIAPSKDPSALEDYLWRRKFKKAAAQCSGERGAILVFEWEGVPHPKIFADAELFNKLTLDTFDQYRHVARIVMRCKEEIAQIEGGYQATTAAYVSDSKVTSYPEALRFLKLDLPL